MFIDLNYMVLVAREMFMGFRNKTRVRNKKFKIVSGQLNLLVYIGRLDQLVDLKLIHECCYFFTLNMLSFSCEFLNGKPAMNAFLRNIKDLLNAKLLNTVL